MSKVKADPTYLCWNCRTPFKASQRAAEYAELDHRKKKKNKRSISTSKMRRANLCDSCLREELASAVTGDATMTRSDDIRSVLKLVEQSGKCIAEIERAGFPTGSAYRLYYTAIVDIYCRQQSFDRSLGPEERAGWKAIAFVERMTMQRLVDGVPNPRWISFDAFDDTAFRGNFETDDPPMGLMCETCSKFDRENSRRSRRGIDQLQRPTAFDVEAWIDETMKRYEEAGYFEELPTGLDQPRDPRETSTYLHIKSRYHGNK